jgi:hypothetical protein
MNVNNGPNRESKQQGPDAFQNAHHMTASLGNTTSAFAIDRR